MLLELDVPTIILEIVNFVVLAVLLYYFLFRPVMEQVEARAVEKQRLLAEAEEDREQAARLRSEIEQRLEQVDREAAEIVDGARQRLELERQEVMDAVRREADRILEQAQIEAERVQERHLSDFRQDLLDTFKQVCTGIIGQVAPQGAHDALVEQLTERVWEMGRQEMAQVETIRRSLGERTPTVRVITARDLSPEQQRNLVRTFSAVADRNVSVDLELDPSLAAGLRVRIGDLVIDNSIARQVSDLHEQVESALQGVGNA